MNFDPLVDERVAPNVVVTRSERGDPLIVPRGGTVPVEYTRASNLAQFLTVDTYQLSRWRERYKIQGVARHPDLAARAAAVHYSTGPITGTQPTSARQAAAKELDAVGDEAAERMGISEAANLGTAAHALTEPENHNGQIHPAVAVAVAGYDEVTLGLERIASEVFVVNDELRAAGTFDSVYTSPEYPGYALIGDTKTGKSYHQAEFEIQLAVYRGGEVYLGDPEMRPGEGFLRGDGAELPVHQRLTFEEYLGMPIHPSVGLLVHTSVTGSPKARVVKLDLERGARLAAVAAQTRDARQEIDKVGIGEKMDCRGVARMALDAKLAECVTREAGLALYGRFKPVWKPADTALMKERFPDG